MGKINKHTSLLLVCNPTIRKKDTNFKLGTWHSFNFLSRRVIPIRCGLHGFYETSKKSSELKKDGQEGGEENFVCKQIHLLG